MKPISINVFWVVLCFGVVFELSGAERTIYVSAEAPADGDGSKAKPFKELVQARDFIRAARKSGNIKTGDSITVLVLPGSYRCLRTFELTAEDSGVKGFPIIYKSLKPDSVSFYGGISIPAGEFHPVADKTMLERLVPEARGRVLVCDLTKYGISFEPFKDRFRGAPVAPWLYINGEPMTIARYPNENQKGGWAEFSKAVDTGLPKPDSQDPQLKKPRGGSFVFEDDRPVRWKIDEGVWLLGYWTHDWFEEVIKVASYDRDKKIITLAEPHMYGIASGTWGAAKRRFFAMNIFDEIDAPGEWYLDRQKKLLYLYPPQNFNNRALIVLATLTQPFIKANNAQYVKFIGLNFEYSHGDGIALDNTKGIEIISCRIANLAGSGISVNGSENTIRSCDIFNLGKAGISLNGGDRKMLVSANNVAINNHIHHYGKFQRTYAAGIGVNGCGQIVKNNRIHDAPHNAVLYGGNEHLFEKNEVYRVVLETGDAGAFYTGRDWTSQGNVLRHNFIHHLGEGDSSHVNTMGVYLDDCDCGDTLDGNIFYRAGRAIMIGGGRDNIVLNNLVLECPIGIHIDARGTTWKQWNNPADPSWHLEAKAQRLNYTQPPWSVKYPKLATIMQEEPQWPLGNVLQNNVFVDCSKQVYDFDANTRKILDRLEISNNLVVNTTGNSKIALSKGIKGFRDLIGAPENPIDLGFKDLKNMNLSLNKNARLFKELPSFKPIPFEQIGLFVDEYRRVIPPRF
ncbi:MAG: right-handed parallel beta-helix repeat-containing protein [Verrucomicrobiia bacterium]|jgi:hypothetical protein